VSSTLLRFHVDQGNVKGAPEDRATDSLRYILTAYHGRKLLNETAKTVLQDLLGLPFRDELFSSLCRLEVRQTLANGGKPDIAVFADEGSQLSLLRLPTAFLEAKRYTGFTERQPFAYLDGLHPSKPGIVCVIAPKSRIGAVWDEICTKAMATKKSISAVQSREGLRWSYILDGTLPLKPERVVSLLSWDDLLERLRRAFLLAGAHSTVSDIDQLKGLCDVMEDRWVDPLTEAEICRGRAKESRNLLAILDQIRSKIFEHEPQGSPEELWADLDELGFDIVLPGLPHLWIGIQWKYWAQYGLSPFWAAAPLQANEMVMSMLRTAFKESVPAHDDKQGKDWMYVPLIPKFDTAPADVIQDLVQQFGRFCTLVRTAP